MRRVIFATLFVLFSFCGCVGHVGTAKAKEVHNQISAEAYCVLESSTSRILAAKNEDKRLPMASTTKIVTAILAIENLDDLDEIVEIPREATGIEGSSLYLRQGEHLSAYELLLGLMLRSGNDAAMALALHTFGSLEAYQKAANEFVLSLGCENTNIVTPNGLHDDNHYTSAKDLAKISSYAMKNEVFRDIVGKVRATISNGGKDSPRYLKNKNKMLTTYDGATGVKTGYTKKAGRCLVSSAKREKMELVCVVLNAQNWFDDSTKLLDEAFANFGLVELLPEHYHVGKIAVECGDHLEANVVSQKGFCFPLSARERTQIHKQIELPEKICAPVEENQCVGKICIYLENELLFEENLYTIESVKSTRIGDIYKGLWENMF